ncbi:unnamed protein product [Prunus brigantina]
MNRDSDKARRDLAFFFFMKPNDKKEFLKCVSSVKFPDGYASNIARCVNVDEGKFTGLKSHDCHVFMQHLFPVGIRHLLSEDVVKPITLLSTFFSQLTAKTLRKTDMFQLCHDIVQVLCNFEMIFPPAFFTSMIHAMVHLPEEALLAGPIVYLDDPKAGSGWKGVQKMDHRNVYAIPELDPTDNDVDNMADQRLESSMENDAETLRDTNPPHLSPLLRWKKDQATTTFEAQTFPASRRIFPDFRRFFFGLVLSPLATNFDT